MLNDNLGSAQRFLREILDFQALMGGVMSVLHPAQYSIMRATLVHTVNSVRSQAKPAPPSHSIEDIKGLQNLLQFWGSGFMGLSIIQYITKTLLKNKHEELEWYTTY
jgi:hypothetical protein